MNRKGFKDELQSLLIKYDLLPRHPGKMGMVVSVSPELKVGEVRLTPELVIK